MIIQYLGTAAAEGVPALFCDCENCRKARKAGGRNLRSRSQALVNGRLLIDFPCDTLWHLTQNSLNLLDVEACIITHDHNDHLAPIDLGYSRAGFAHPWEGWKGFHVFGSTETCEKVQEICEVTPYLHPHHIEPYVPFDAAGMTITAVKANHGTPNPYNYIINDGEKTFFYGHDTGTLFDETWKYLKDHRIHFDVVSLDCTEAMKEPLTYDHHMAFYRNQACRSKMMEIGAADEKTVFVLNHFSHNGLHSNYDDFKPLANADGFEVSYDGMVLEV